MCFLMLTSSLEVAKTKQNKKKNQFDLTNLPYLMYKLVLCCIVCSPSARSVQLYSLGSGLSAVDITFRHDDASPAARGKSTAVTPRIITKSTTHGTPVHPQLPPLGTASLLHVKPILELAVSINTCILYVTGRSSLAVYDVVDSENDVCNFRRINGFPVSSRHPHSGDIVTISSLLGQQRAVFASM